MILLLSDSKLLLYAFQTLFEVVDFDAQDNIGIRLNKTSVGVKGKAAATKLLGQSLQCHVVQSQVEYCVHHSSSTAETVWCCLMKSKRERERRTEIKILKNEIQFQVVPNLVPAVETVHLHWRHSTSFNSLPQVSWHGCACSRADWHQKWVGGVTEFTSSAALDQIQSLLHLKISEWVAKIKQKDYEYEWTQCKLKKGLHLIFDQPRQKNKFNNYNIAVAVTKKQWLTSRLFTLHKLTLWIALLWHCSNESLLDLKDCHWSILISSNQNVSCQQPKYQINSQIVLGKTIQTSRLFFELRGILVAILAEVSADLCRESETWWDGQLIASHRSQICTTFTELIVHVRHSIGLEKDRPCIGFFREVTGGLTGHIKSKLQLYPGQNHSV